MKRWKWRVAGGFTLIELMVVVAIIGILAAVAIPAFMKNVKKAKTTEAVTNVKKLYDGARAYYMEEMNSKGSTKPIPKQFPGAAATQLLQPTLGTCCTPGGGGKCAPSPILWADPVWQALKFSMDDPHYFSYGYVRNGPSSGGTTAQGLQTFPALGGPEWFFADAHGDLNCDGTYSTFEMLGAVQSDGSVTGQAGMFRDKELE